MPKYTMSLSVSSIKRLQKQIQNYKDNILQQKVDLLAKTLSERGVDVAQSGIADLDAIFTGELIESIHSEYRESRKGVAIFAIVADSAHAAFVEFGTGSRGEDVPYPGKLPDGVSWVYHDGETVKQNPVTGRYYWFYPGDDGKWHYTEGMPSRPFMFNTANQLRQEVVEIAKEIFGE